MGRKLYVGNLPFSAIEESLGAEFVAHGRVESVKLKESEPQAKRTDGSRRGLGGVSGW